jgi:hypothetical protein
VRRAFAEFGLSVTEIEEAARAGLIAPDVDRACGPFGRTLTRLLSGHRAGR